MTKEQYDILRSALREDVIIEVFTEYCWVLRDVRQDRVICTIFNEFNPLQIGVGSNG